MRKPAAAVVGLVCLGMLGAGGIAVAGSPLEPHRPRAVVISNDGGMLASIPLAGDTFAVSYRNSIYGTVAEERYTVQDDGSYRLVQLAADQLAVLEEYYAVPGPPSAAGDGDRREWVADPDPGHPAEFGRLSLAATDLGRRTVYVPGAPPLELWKLVEDSDPFVVLSLKETP
ncbi:hypothetical protein QK290_14725 [Pseudarthrobacter sp. AL07]|uniref:hypothetical protein n=1 Tax=unclassified Pseudarthrobacter TaxID=2647000 RepID=UPI00249B980E|nr:MULTISPECIES: hypothetical protein [unclassified Pseudarthrobacter]MDI3195612.1 hypothetical protein [Pseudarthrobacter sp. AL20]MDI3209728.1 hypothetical protein [Pseudarthrobacter sp. AL07]